MAFIKIQKLKYNSDGTIRSGSASIVESIYVKGAEKSFQTGCQGATRKDCLHFRRQEVRNLYVSNKGTDCLRRQI